jgi:hypothetical protein
MAARIDLSPVEARIRRAAVHTAALEAAVAAYVAIPPYHRRESIDHMTGVMTVRADMYLDPPADIALILRKCSSVAPAPRPDRDPASAAS